MLRIMSAKNTAKNKEAAVINVRLLFRHKFRHAILNMFIYLYFFTLLAIVFR